MKYQRTRKPLKWLSHHIADGVVRARQIKKPEEDWTASAQPAIEPASFLFPAGRIKIQELLLLLLLLLRSPSPACW